MDGFTGIFFEYPVNMRCIKVKDFRHRFIGDFFLVVMLYILNNALRKYKTLIAIRVIFYV